MEEDHLSCFMPTLVDLKGADRLGNDKKESLAKDFASSPSFKSQEVIGLAGCIWSKFNVNNCGTEVV